MSSPDPVPSGVTHLSVVVPVHNGGDAFRRCLDGIASCEPLPDEVVVVADGESDGAWRYAETYALADRTRTLVLEETRGPGNARNEGARRASGDVLLFLDADVVPARDVIGRVRERFDSDPDLGALIGSYDDAPGHDGFLSQYRNLLHHYTHQTGSREAVTFWGACGAVRREAFAEAGGFDPDFGPPSVEDIDLGYRLHQANHRIALDPEIQVCHLKEWTLAGMVKTDVFRRAAPWTGLLLRYSRLDNDLNIRVSSRVSVLAVGGLLATLALALVSPLWLFGTVVLAALLIGLNRDFYGFLARTKGTGFMLRAIPVHGLYFLCAAAGSALGTAQHVLDGRPEAPEAQPDATLAPAYSQAA